MDETNEAFDSWIKALGNQYAKGVMDERRRITNILDTLHGEMAGEGKGISSFWAEAIDRIERSSFWAEAIDRIERGR